MACKHPGDSIKCVSQGCVVLFYSVHCWEENLDLKLSHGLWTSKFDTIAMRIHSPRIYYSYYTSQMCIIVQRDFLRTS